MRERWEAWDKRLINSLNDTHEYLAAVIDPILAPVIEKTVLHRPQDVAKYISHSISGKSTDDEPHSAMPTVRAVVRPTKTHR